MVRKAFREMPTTAFYLLLIGTYKLEKYAHRKFFIWFLHTPSIKHYTNFQLQSNVILKRPHQQFYFFIVLVEEKENF